MVKKNAHGEDFGLISPNLPTQLLSLDCRKQTICVLVVVGMLMYMCQMFCT